MGELKILLIDDDASINYLNKIIIERANIHAVVCDRTEAANALHQISQGEITPNLILLDLNMPVMNGWQFLEQYERLPVQSRTSKIIILSSTINPADKQRASESSVIHDFLRKPLSIDDVKYISQSLSN